MRRRATLAALVAVAAVTACKKSTQADSEAKDVSGTAPTRGNLLRGFTMFVPVAGADDWGSKVKTQSPLKTSVDELASGWSGPNVSAPISTDYRVSGGLGIKQQLPEFVCVATCAWEKNGKVIDPTKFRDILFQRTTETYQQAYQNPAQNYRSPEYMESYMSVLNREFCSESPENPIPVRAYTGEQLAFAMGVTQRYAASGTISRQDPNFWDKFVTDLKDLSSDTSYVLARDEAGNIQSRTGQQAKAELGTVTMSVYAVLEDLPSLNCFDVWTQGAQYRKTAQEYKGGTPPAKYPPPVQKPSQNYTGVQKPYQTSQTPYQTGGGGTAGYSR